MSVSTILVPILVGLPMLAVAGIGLLCALMHWGRMPSAALPVVLGCLLLLGVAVVRPVVQTLVSRTLGPMDNEQRMLVFNGTAFVFSLAQAAGIGAILYAAFAGAAPLRPIPSASRPSRGVEDQVWRRMK